MVRCSETRLLKFNIPFFRMINDFAEPGAFGGDPSVIEFGAAWGRLAKAHRNQLLDEYGVAQGSPDLVGALIRAAGSIAALLIRVRQLLADSDLVETRDENGNILPIELLPQSLQTQLIRAEERHTYHPFYGDGRAGGFGA
jgi:hypothetical protein